MPYIILIININLINSYIMKKTALLLIIMTVMIVNQTSSQSISDLLDGYYAYDRFWGSVMVTRNGEVIFQKNYGFADKDRNITINTESLFSLASVTKSITAVAIFKLHEEGRLNIYDRVDKYIPGFIDDNTDSLTIVNLLNHTSGMTANLAQTDDFSKENKTVVPGSDMTLEQLIGKFRHTKLKTRPGTKFTYNNYGYVLLARIIEKVTGMDYFTYLDKEIFPAAEMTRTFGQGYLPVQPVKGYTGIGSALQVPVKDEVLHKWMKGAVGLYSSVSDLNRFLEALLSHRLLKAETFNLMLDSCVHTSMGKKLWTTGWEKNVVDGLNYYSHGGSISGFSTRIGFVPEENITIVVLSNLVKDKSHDGLSSVNYSWVDETAEDIIRILNGKRVSYLPLQAGRPRKTAGGNYMSDDTYFMNISYHNDSLYLTMDDRCGFTLFDHNLYNEIKDNSANYEVCRTFAASMIRKDLNSFGNYADKTMQKVLFNENDITKITNFWDNVVSQAGTCSSATIFDKAESQGSTAYTLAFHLDKAEVLMQMSYNQNSLINGFYILKVFPKCNIRTVNLIPTGKNEYFIDGFSYGGYKDFSISFDKRAGILRFKSNDDNFTASRCR